MPSSDGARDSPAVAVSLKPFRAAYWFGGFNGLTWMIVLGAPTVLLAEKLGATAFQVGLLSSFVFLFLPIQVIATALLPRLGFRRQMVTAWGVRALFVAVPFAFALSAPEHPASWMPSLLVASVMMFCIVRAVGVAAHIPWMAAILPDAARGRFFATDSGIVSTVGVVTLLLCATLFDRLADWEAFRIIYMICIAGSAAAAFMLTRLPDTTPPAPIPVATLPAEARRFCLRPGLFRHYLLLVLLGSITASSFVNFTVYYLKVENGIESSRVLMYTAVQFAGMITAMTFVRRTIDVVPFRRFFQVSTALAGTVCLFWWMLVTGSDWLQPGLPLAYFVLGMSFAINNATHFTFLPELSQEHERPVAIAVFTAVQGLMAGLSPMFWGLFLKEAGPNPGLVVPNFATFCAIAMSLSFLSVGLYARLPDHRARPSG